jgi:hypothetical protein
MIEKSKRTSSRPKNYWYWPKPINNIDLIINAVNSISSMDGKEWVISSGNQKKMMELLVEKGMHIHADNMSGRNWMSAFQLYGLVYPKRVENKKIITITPVGKSLKQSTRKSRREIITYQFMKLQFRNPSNARFLEETLKVNPLYVVCKVISELESISQIEMAYFVMKIQNHSEINSTIKEIKKFRKTKKEPEINYKAKSLLRDYANRILRRAFVYTELLEESEKNTYKINPHKKDRVEKFISIEPKIKENCVNELGWNEWYEHYGQIHKSRRNPAGSTSRTNYQARQLAELIKKETELGNYKIKIKKIDEEIQQDHSSLLSLLKQTTSRRSFPILKTATIKGNHLIILDTVDSKKKLKFSKKVKKFEHIIDDAEYSDDSRKFEISVKEIFEEMGLKAIHHGSIKSGVEIEDVEVQYTSKSKTESWAMLVDAKAYSKGYALGTKDRRALKEYFEIHQEKFKKKTNPYECKALCFVTSQFTGNVNNALKKLSKKTVGCSGITATNLLYLLDLMKNNPDKLKLKQILELFSSNEEIIKPTIDSLF